MKKIVIAGGTGFIGTRLTRRIAREGNAAVVLTRRTAPASPHPSVSFVRWEPANDGSWVSTFEGADALINLTGESIGARRWTVTQKERIVRSRLEPIRGIVRAVRATGTRPSVFVSSSAVGYYGDSGDDIVTEDHPRGRGFLADTVARWEEEAGEICACGVRLVLTRTGVVLGRGGDALGRMLLPFRLFVGGPLGSGMQWFPWIHLDDVVEGFLYLMNHGSLSGPFNLAAPGILRMREFASVLGQVLRRPSWFPVPPLILKVLLGEMSEIVLTGQHVISDRLTGAGFEFRFGDLREALREILNGNST